MRESEALERGVAAYHDRVARTGREVEEMEFVLRSVARQAGNVAAAVRLLNGTRALRKRLSVKVVRRWVSESFADRYQQIVEERMDDIERLAGQRALLFAEETRVATELAVGKTTNALNGDKPTEAREFSTTARNLSQVRATEIEKSRLMRDQPTDIHDFNLSEAVEELRDLLGTKPVAIEGEAEEID